VASYWVDSNVFIEAKAGPYAFKVVPSFWKHIDQMLENKVIFSSEMVYKELVGYGDDLSKWLKHRKQNGLCVAVTEEVEDHFAKIADHVSHRYDEANAGDFLKGADGWIIAHALQTKGIVVSQESKHYPNAHKARIPDVCKHFHIKCINLYEMLTLQAAVL
jgi:predicted nucleic acid-binding protein